METGVGALNGTFCLLMCGHDLQDWCSNDLMSRFIGLQQRPEAFP